MTRLLEDPQTPWALRADLVRSRNLGREYATVRKLPQLRAALGDPTRITLGASPLRRAWCVGHHGWKIALLSVIGSGAWYAIHTHVPAQLMAAPTMKHAPASPERAAPPAEPEHPPTAVPSPAAPPPTRAQSTSSLRREIAQLVRVRALIERDPAAAYRLAVRAEREFARGVLSEERQALAIVALAKTGDTVAADERARSFYAHYPRSPMRELVEAALHR